MKFFSFSLLILILLAPCLRAQSSLSSNAELERLYSEDQSDRATNTIDWKVVGPRDVARRQRVLELYRGAELKLGKDLFHAAMILQHGEKPEDFLLSHELCVTAIIAHSTEPGAWLDGAKWLAAASEDRFLESIGRKQRFGTQFRTLAPDPTWHLGEIEEGVTDEMRKTWNVPSLEQAKRREAEMNRKAK
jgi:hypothetical protein